MFDIFLLMLGSIDESTVWTSISFLTGIAMTIDEKTICQKFKVKNYWIFYAVWIFVAVMTMVVAFYFELQGHNL
ncbi:hypothetical protein LP114_04330 [Moraxella bovis]|uniref:hypothetical protein n=1 Tax=Moraxella bovis TaxID=476 RepID=UPI002225E02D|nr:hypothetical protein [Moraxella bovis]UYZ74979.1 hypothetical protein LP093_09400 [Moraxella bovis]UYZ90309.1 hypothetical protein LP114_04330 [Moraxella bovis]UYZ92999.1 hypothetical protein LP103_04440 [Moraxella bovis]UYZ94522.1 hypothetical protein LP121_11690 [Moraxella bovis]